MDFSPVKRGQESAGSPITGHPGMLNVIELQGEPRPQSPQARHPGSTCGQLCATRENVLRRFHPGRLRVDDGEPAIVLCPKDGNFPNIVLDLGRCEKIIHDRARWKVKHRQPIALGHSEGMVGGYQASGAGHILDDDGGIAGYMFRQMAREKAASQVDAASRCKAGDDP